MSALPPKADMSSAPVEQASHQPPRVGGGAVAGTILGAILGGGKGAAIGAAAGAGAGAATLAASDPKAATLAAGTSMTVRILQPVTITQDNKDE